MAFHYTQLHEAALGMLKTANKKRNTDKKRIDELKEELDYYQEGVMAVGDERDRLKVDLERTRETLQAQTGVMQELEQQIIKLTESLKKEHDNSKAKNERLMKFEDVETQLMIAD